MPSKHFSAQGGSASGGKLSFLFLAAIILTLGLSISFQSLLAAWTAPLSNPPACLIGNPGCDAPLNSGPFIQTKAGALWINTDGLSPYGLIVEQGKVGIGTVGPGQKLDVAGNITASLYYDRDNSGYYVDPASTSRLNAVTPNIIALTTGNSPNAGYNHYAIYEQPGTWTHPYPDLMIEYHTGISYIAYYGYGGHRFYTGYSPDASPTTLAFSVGEGDHNVRVYNNLYVSGTAYANGQALCQANGTNCPVPSTNADTVDGYHLNQGLLTSNSPTFAGLTTTGRYYSNEWIQMNNYSGLYSPNNGAHFYPNNASYGSWRIAGSRNGWQGLEFDAAGGQLSLMMGHTSQGWGGQQTGIHNNSYGWLWRFDHSTLAAGNVPIARIPDIGSASVNYATSAGNSDTVDGWHRDDIRANATGGSVGYANSAGNADTVDGYHAGSGLLRWNVWDYGNYYQTNGDIYMGWAGNWLSTVLVGKAASGHSHSGYMDIAANRLYDHYTGGAMYAYNGRLYNGWLGDSVSVNYANSAGNANTTDGQHLGTGNSPTFAGMDISGNLSVSGSVWAGGGYSGAGCDIAERYTVSEDSSQLEPGDLAVLDQENEGKIKKSDMAYSKMIVGVISTKPNLEMGVTEITKDQPPVALLGRVPTKVTNENGPIKIGDLIVSSSKPGYGMRCADYAKCQGTVVGKAMENFEASEGKIEVLIKTGF